MRQAPLVLLHGFTGVPESFDAVRQLLRTYAPEQVYAPFLAGHGPDERGVGPETTQRQVEPFPHEVNALAADLQCQGIGVDRKALLVGYSLGARLALGLLFAHSASFYAGILIGVNPGLRSESERRSRRRDDERRAAKLMAEGTEAFSQEWEREPIFQSQHSLPEARQRRQAEWRRCHTPQGLAYSLRHAGLAEMPNYWPKLPELDLPVHLVVGALDERFRAIAEAMNAELPRATLTVVPNAGHNVLLEAPEALAMILDGLPRTDVP